MPPLSFSAGGAAVQPQFLFVPSGGVVQSPHHHAKSASNPSFPGGAFVAFMPKWQRLLGVLIAFVTGMALMQTMMYCTQQSISPLSSSVVGTTRMRKSLSSSSWVVEVDDDTPTTSITSLSSSSSSYYNSFVQQVMPILHNPSDHQQDTCRFYMAESAVAPNVGLGMFVGGTGLLEGDMVGFPDICLFVTEPPQQWSHLHSHSWSENMFFGPLYNYNQNHQLRIACEGYGTIYNTMPNSHVNVRIQSAIQQTHAGVTRNVHAGAGSFSHHYGIHGVAMDTIAPGSELTIDYYDWDFQGKDYTGLKRPQRPIQELQDNGWCIDHIEVRPSTVDGAGRGAFVKRHLPQGTVVVPAPLQVFSNRAAFQRSQPEQLYVNYCFQPPQSRMLFFPYGPGVNLINHNGQEPNVALQWSNNPLHHSELLDMNYRTFWNKVQAGSLILEVVAIRDLQAGEELFMDYGNEWEQAWKAHVQSWTAPRNATQYRYPEDMDETSVLKTVEEQEQSPNPINLITMCETHNTAFLEMAANNDSNNNHDKQQEQEQQNWLEQRHAQWRGSNTNEEWWWNMV